MSAVDPARAVAETRKRIQNTRELVQVSHRIFARSLATYKDAEATTRRLHERLSLSRSAIRRQGPRRTARRLHLLVSARIDEHRLPSTIDSIIGGAPGFGGACEACDGYMPPTQMVMSVPHVDTFVYLHAECYAVWRAQCCLRAALRRIA
jgi:hypothetical protein